MHYLYKITNRLDGKVYIGQSNNNRRWSQHKYFAEHPEKTGQYIHRAMAKHGIDNFSFEVIDFAFNRWQTDCLEDNYIIQYDSRNPEKGYNLARGSNNGWLGMHHTEEAKEKNRQAHLGLSRSEESIEKQSQTMREKCENGWMPVNIFTSETAAVWQGKTFSDEHRQAISESNKGREMSEETRRKISEAQIGKMISDEARQKMSDAAKGQHRSPETEFKKGMEPWNKGKGDFLSPEVRAQVNASKKGKHASPATEFKKKVFSRQEMIDIQNHLSQGKSLRQIEKLTGINRHIISRELNRLGLR